MNEQMKAYDAALEQLFSVPRTLPDRTPVTGPSPEERLLMTEFMLDCARQGSLPGFLGCYELGEGANPYVTYLLCLLPLIEAHAQSKGQTVVWAAVSSNMVAKAQLNFSSLFVLSRNIQFVDWGDLALLARRADPVLAKLFIIGDMDFEPGNTRRQLSSGNGMVRHDETIGFINACVRNKHRNMILFHRKGWAGVVDVKALKNVERKSGCFIATACHGSAGHPAVEVLRRYRDERLAAHRAGRGFIRLYERFSPAVADLIRPRHWARGLVRFFLVRPLSRWAAGQLGVGNQAEHLAPKCENGGRPVDPGIAYDWPARP